MSNKIGGNNYGKNHNLLIFGGNDKSQTYDAWKRDVDRLTPRKWDKTAKEVGYPGELDNSINFDNKPKATNEVFSLPPEFCPYCPEEERMSNSRKADGRSYGMFIINKNYEGLGIRKGDSFQHYTCNACMNAMVFPSNPTGLLLPDSIFAHRRKEFAAEAEEVMVEYVQAQRQAGVTGYIFGSEGRRKKFEQYDGDYEQR